MLETQDLGFGYAKGPVLFQDVNVCLEIGESLAILGPSGIGKSTLLFILGGLLEPTAGGVVYRDSSPPAPDDSAWIIQSLNVLGARSVLDNAMLGAAIDGDRSELSARAREALAKVGLEMFAKRRAATLSGGETQRLTVARALVSRRTLLFADEPTNQLDSGWTARVSGLLAAEAASGCHTKTVVIVTHDPLVASRCDGTLDLGATAQASDR